MFTSDKDAPSLDLIIQGDVELFANVSPKSLNMNGKMGTKFKSEVRITPREEYPFAITDTSAKIGKDIGFSLAQDGKKGYLLTVENKKMEKGRYYDYISLKTDSKIRPEIRISVRGNVFDPNDPNKGKNGQPQNFLEVIQRAQEKQQKLGNGNTKKSEASPQNQEKINNFLKMLQEQQKKETPAQ